MSEVKYPKLAGQGKLKVEWAQEHNLFLFHKKKSLSLPKEKLRLLRNLFLCETPYQNGSARELLTGCKRFVPTGAKSSTLCFLYKESGGNKYI